MKGRRGVVNRELRSKRDHTLACVCGVPGRVWEFLYITSEAL